MTCGDTWIRRFILGVVLMSFAWLGVTRFLGAGRDDIFITLWAGENLAAGRGLVNQNYEPLEISSSLLHVVIVALIALVAPDNTYVLNKFVGLLAGVALLLAMARYRALLFPRERGRSMALAASLLAVGLAPGIQYWSLGGLETPFVTYFLLLCAVRYLAYWNVPSFKNEMALVLVQIIYLTIRPEAFSIVLFALVFNGICVYCRRWRAGALRVFLLPCAAFVLLTVFRKVCLGSFFPNPVYAKAEMSKEMFLYGWDYIGQFYGSGCFPFLLGIASLFLGIRHLCRFAAPRPRCILHLVSPEGGLVFLFGLVLMQHLLVIAAGGDWMEYYRFMVPIFPLQVILAAGLAVEGLQTVWDRSGWSSRPVWRFAPSVAAALVLIPIWGSSVFGDGAIQYRSSPARKVENLSRPCSLTEIWAARNTLDLFVKQLNGPYRRDDQNLFPVLERFLGPCCQKSGELIILTGQMGRFPYEVRHRYSEYPLYFVDINGLCHPTVANLAPSHSPLGIRGRAEGTGWSIDDLMCGKLGKLSTYIRSLQPNFIYECWCGPEDKKCLKEQGFVALWEQSNVFLYHKPPDASESQASNRL